MLHTAPFRETDVGTALAPTGGIAARLAMHTGLIDLGPDVSERYA